MDWSGWFCLLAVYAIGGVAGAAAYSYTKTGQSEEPVLGIERVGAFALWWLVLPVAALRFAGDIVKAIVEWLFTKN